MAEADIAVRRREARGKGPVRRLRAQGWVPGVIYGHGRPAEALAVERRALQRLLDTGHHIVTIRQEEGGEARRALIREVQVQSVTQELLHVDFVEVSAHERVTLTIPLIFRGEPAGVKEGGVPDVNLREIEIECSADAAMDELRVDISSLELGKNLHVHELPLPENVSAVTDGMQVVVACRRPREEVEAEEPEAAQIEAPAQPEVLAERKREDREKERERGKE